MRRAMWPMHAVTATIQLKWELVILGYQRIRSLDPASPVIATDNARNANESKVGSDSSSVAG